MTLQSATVTIVPKIGEKLVRTFYGENAPGQAVDFGMDRESRLNASVSITLWPWAGGTYYLWRNGQWSCDFVESPEPAAPYTALSAVERTGPCDGSHGRFCPDCAQLNRWADRG